MSKVSRSGRVFRLCQKELRESLRDRRTIITLVLMPLLVYPLLSMILQRLLLSSTTQNEVQVIRIGLDDIALQHSLEEAIEFGKHVLAVRGNETLSIAHPEAPATILTGQNANSQSAVQHILGQKIEFFHIQRDGRQALLSGAIDLLVHGKAAPNLVPKDPSLEQTGTPGASASAAEPNTVEGQPTQASQQPVAGDPAPRPAPPATDSSNSRDSSDSRGPSDSSQSRENQDTASATTSSPARLVGDSKTSSATADPAKGDQAGGTDSVDPSTVPGPRRRRTDIMRETLSAMPEDRYLLEYVPQDRHSEVALQLLRSLFAAINEQMTEELIGVFGADYHPRITMSAAPIKMPSSAPSTLASLVPLVLVLMTIAGAVYPAIDLTAGERERGTLEAMIVSPTPRPMLLLAKYVAVVTVALLTAVANLLAMSVTLWASGLGRLVLGNSALSLGTIVQILSLLVLFAMFFSAVLLSITSFAKSFKEAQAYLIPVMLVSLAPGVLSLLPQVRLTNVLAAVPLANIVLLSRDVLVGSASREAGVISVVCTFVYAIAALAVASRLFGSDASLQGSQGSWRDFIRRPEQASELPSVDQMALTMACLFPLYFMASTSLPLLKGSLSYQLLMSAVISWLLIFGLPTWVSYHRRLNFKATFLLGNGRGLAWLTSIPAVVLLAGSLWMISHELMIISQQLGLATFSEEQMKRAQAFAEKLPEIPLALLLFTGAVTPALCEEWFFRGFVMSSLRRAGTGAAIVGSALLFALMHVLTSNILSLERFLPSLFMGLVLGLVAWKSQSLWPGVILHALHNGFLFSVGHFKTQLHEWGIGLEENSHLPLSWLAGGVLASIVGLFLIVIRRPLQREARC